ncbi:MAG: hypothetical protein KGI97_01265 [Alphaproteobacteria bacterium]|nr:hypothetical protein [Alphaproteobacteria bacterium]
MSDLYFGVGEFQNRPEACRDSVPVVDNGLAESQGRRTYKFNRFPFFVLLARGGRSTQESADGDEPVLGRQVAASDRAPDCPCMSQRLRQSPFFRFACFAGGVQDGIRFSRFLPKKAVAKKKSRHGAGDPRQSKKTERHRRANQMGKAWRQSHKKLAGSNAHDKLWRNSGHQAGLMGADVGATFAPGLFDLGKKQHRQYLAENVL